MFKHRLTVVLDIDGVMADVETEFCMMFGDKNRHIVRFEHRYPEQRGHIENWMADRTTYRGLLPIPVGIEIAKWLATTSSVVHVVTARPLNSKKITEEWLAKQEVPYHDLAVVSHNKSEVIKLLMPDIIVDDIIGVCTQAYNDVPEVHPILVAHPWNDTVFFPRITKLSQFQRIFQRVANEKLLTDIEGVELA